MLLGCMLGNVGSSVGRSLTLNVFRHGWCHSALLPILPTGDLQYCSEKHFFSLDRHYKRDIGKTVDRTP